MKNLLFFAAISPGLALCHPCFADEAPDQVISLEGTLVRGAVVDMGSGPSGSSGMIYLANSFVEYGHKPSEYGLNTPDDAVLTPDYKGYHKVTGNIRVSVRRAKQDVGKVVVTNPVTNSPSPVFFLTEGHSESAKMCLEGSSVQGAIVTSTRKIPGASNSYVERRFVEYGHKLSDYGIDTPDHAILTNDYKGQYYADWYIQITVEKFDKQVGKLTVTDPVTEYTYPVFFLVENETAPTKCSAKLPAPAGLLEPRQ